MHHDSKSPRYGGISQLPHTRSSGCLSACPPALVNTDLGVNGRTMHHDSKSTRYGGTSQLPRTRSSGCLSACPPALINIDLAVNGRTQKPCITTANHPAPYTV